MICLNLQFFHPVINFSKGKLKTTFIFQSNVVLAFNEAHIIHTYMYGQYLRDYHASGKHFWYLFTEYSRKRILLRRKQQMLANLASPDFADFDNSIKSQIIKVKSNWVTNDLINDHWSVITANPEVKTSKAEKSSSLTLTNYDWSQTT